MSGRPSTARSRPRLRGAVPPRPLALLLVVVACFGVAWALAVAPWQSPDEVAHFAYAQSLAENGRLPGSKAHMPISSDQQAADAASGASRGAFYPRSSPPNWNAADARAYTAAEKGAARPSPHNGGGPNPASANPPLYYGFAAVAYLLDHSGTAFGRLYAMQLWGVLLLLGSTIAAWLLAGETFGRRRLAQFACAAVVGLLPMDTYISTTVNPDALMITAWTFALWLGARVLNRGARTPDVVAVCAVTAAAVLTKATSYALVVPVVAALAFAWWRRPAPERPAALRRIAVCLLALVVPVLGWFALARSLHRPAINSVVASTPGRHPVNLAQALSYLWQFYLPRLPFMTRLRESPELPLYNFWLKQGTGVYGWLSVGLPSWLYTAGTVVFAAVSVAALGLLARLRRTPSLVLLGFYGLTLIALLVLLHATEYRSIINGSGAILQGRYLLPIIGLLGLAVALIVVRLPNRWRTTACAATLGALFILQFVSLAAVTKGFYL